MGSFVVFFSFFSCVRGTFTSFFDFVAGNSGVQPLVVSPTVMVPVVGSVLLLRPIFFFSYFCRCVSALAVNIEL